MTGKQELIRKIIDIEWDMFRNVPNIGGTAVCQEDMNTFKIMRLSQAMSWSEAALASYLIDLTEAQESIRNLLTEKYARMMKSTSPLEYALIEHLLPPMAIEHLVLIENIVKLVLEWEQELLERFPNLLKRGRPIYSTDDAPGITSVETYLRGELSTYSLRTLKLYYENVLKQKYENINGSEITLNYIIKHYGFNSLEEANQKLKDTRWER
ncbi:DUF4125 family protein [Paradesulfitobacterium ferrireducens]|uniref:DUF4125 family protein n=1 Tax=Paradesulfitobacterium ferrireducens TaxID=2816476 RepID=UPI001A8CDB73|nr:DUF4125 family protein [Paradesulfitobacterium ferrireducens]